MLCVLSRVFPAIVPGLEKAPVPHCWATKPVKWWRDSIIVPNPSLGAWPCSSGDGLAVAAVIVQLNECSNEQPGSGWSLGLLLGAPCSQAPVSHGGLELPADGIDMFRNDRRQQMENERGSRGDILSETENGSVEQMDRITQRRACKEKTVCAEEGWEGVSWSTKPHKAPAPWEAISAKAIYLFPVWIYKPHEKSLLMVESHVRLNLRGTSSDWHLLIRSGL